MKDVSLRYLSLLLILCLSSVGGSADDTGTQYAPAGQEASEQVEFRFDGVWKPKGAMLSGVLLPPPALNAIKLEIDKNTYEVAIEGEEQSDKGTFTLDESMTPKRMTIKSSSGPNQGKTILAIYEIKAANAMRVCYDLSGTAFPQEFKAPKGSVLYLVGYRRQPPLPASPSPSSNSG